MTLRELADQGLLRAYILQCDGRAWAYLIGFQLGSTYVAYETAYDPDFARLGPGKVLFLLALEDLFRQGTHWIRPKRFSFGQGDCAYKAFFGTSASLETDLVLIRQTFANHAWQGSHRLLRGAVQAAKRLLRREGDRSKPRPR